MGGEQGEGRGVVEIRSGMFQMTHPALGGYRWLLSAWADGSTLS